MSILYKTKICKYCGKEKGINEYYTAERSPDGYRPYCKICDKLKAKINYEKNYTPRPKRQKVCSNCGAKFEGVGQKLYCSTNCRNNVNKEERRNKTYEINCKGCGKKALVNNKTAKYCTSDCYAQNSPHWPSYIYTESLIKRNKKIKNIPKELVGAYKANIQLKREIKKINNNE